MPMNYAYGSAVTEAMSFLLPCIPDLITCVNEYASFTTTIVTKHITPGNISYHITTHHHYHYMRRLIKWSLQPEIVLVLLINL